MKSICLFGRTFPQLLGENGVGLFYYPEKQVFYLRHSFGGGLSSEFRSVSNWEFGLGTPQPDFRKIWLLLEEEEPEGVMDLPGVELIRSWED